MSWIEKLEEKIAALKDEDFKEEYIAGPDRFLKIPAAKIEIPLDFDFRLPDFHRAMGCVNAAPIGLAPAGCVMLDGLSIDRDGAKAHFSIRRSIPWNRGLPVDSLGQKPYPVADFSTLPG